jgi:hypothetical protein
MTATRRTRQQAASHDHDPAALVARAVAAAPPLTDSQRQQVSDLMPPAEHEPAAEDAA